MKLWILFTFLFLFPTLASARMYPVIPQLDRSGVEVSGDITTPCDNNDIWKYSTSSSEWSCQADATGGGGGTNAVEDFMIDISSGGGVSVDTTEVSHDLTWSDGALSSIRFTWNLSGSNDPTIEFRDGGINFDRGTISIDLVNNRVGIGTDAPDEKLTVTGNTKTSGEFIEGAGSTASTGGFGILTDSKSSSFTADGSATLYLCDASGGAITATLPAAATTTNRVYIFKKTDTTTNDVTIDGNASETIDGATNYALTVEDESITIISDGTNWRDISTTPRMAFINTGLVFDSEIIFRQKVDIGIPGSIQGLDIGEGGSYSTDTFGTTIVEAFSFDQSAASGSRFTALTLTSNNTLLAVSGDRFYVGSPNKFWAMRLEIGVAKTTELYAGRYWNGSALTDMTYMGILKDSVTSLGDGIMEQTAEQEYTSFDGQIDGDWATADDVLDVIPNSASALYWVAFDVPTGGFSTAPRVDDIKVRGTDSDFATGISQLIFWGKSRVENHEVLSSFTKKSGGQPAIEDIAFTSTTTIPLLALRNSQSDGLTFSFQLLQGLDTGNKLKVTIDWFTDNSGEVDWTLQYYIMTQGTVIGSGQSDTASVDTSITPSAADALQTLDDISNDHSIDISTLKADDLIVFELIRKGSSDTNSGKVYVVDAVVHYVLWSQGEHV